MKIFKRIALFLIVNIAIMVVLTGVFSLLGFLGFQHYITDSGLNLTAILILSVVIGFGGSFISLLLSKKMAQWMMGVKIIATPQTADEQVLFRVVEQIAQQHNIKRPDIGIYESAEVNAFATGASKNKALVAVSRGLLQKMDRDEVEGVLAHEMAHVLNGDMVTLALIQGIVNTFVIFFARIAAFMVGKLLSRNEEIGTLTYFGLIILFEIIFGILASTIVLAFSRFREFRADAGGAQYVGKPKMIKALQKLQMLQSHIKTGKDQKAFAAFKISDKPSFLGGLFSSHPPLGKRIERLQESLS